MKNNQLIAIILESVRMGMGGGYQREDDLIDRSTVVIKNISPKNTKTETIKEEIRFAIKRLHKIKFWVRVKRGWLGRSDSVFTYEEPIVVEKKK